MEGLVSYSSHWLLAALKYRCGPGFLTVIDVGSSGRGMGFLAPSASKLLLKRRIAKIERILMGLEGKVPVIQ